MSKIFIIGATGGVGSRLIPLLLNAGHQVTGLHRSSEQADQLKAMGVNPAAGDIIDLTVAELTDLIRGHDVIIFSAGAAGSGMDRTSAIDAQGPIKALAAAKANGIARFYLVSAFMDAGRNRERKAGFEHYIECKRIADVAVADSGLDWVILRPGTLISEKGDGLVNANRAIPYGTVARGNVALFLAELIAIPEIRQEIIELTDGQMPVTNAVKALLR